jgi:hypothetical protein
LKKKILFILALFSIMGAISSISHLPIIRLLGNNPQYHITLNQANLIQEADVTSETIPLSQDLVSIKGWAGTTGTSYITIPTTAVTTFARRKFPIVDTNNNASDFEVVSLTSASISNSVIGFAQDFNAKTENKVGMCNATDLQWTYLSNNFNALSESAKTEFNTLSQADILLARTRYQYLRSFNPSGLPAFGTPLNSRFLETVPSQDFNLVSILMMFIMTSLGALFIKKRLSHR